MRLGDEIRSHPRRQRLALLAVVVGLLLLGTAYAAAATAEAGAKGELFDYTDGTIYKVRFFHHWDLYVEPDVKPSLDVVDSYILVVVSTIGLAGLGLLRWLGLRRPRGTELFLLVTGLGALYLAADE